MPSSFLPGGREVNIYAMPALLSLVLLVVETLFLAVALPETRGIRIASPQETERSMADGRQTTTHGVEAAPLAKASVQQRLRQLEVLRTAHFMFLAIFSGIEFSLTFLTFDRELACFELIAHLLMLYVTVFDWDNKQNGSLLGSMGVMSALLQGGYVRRAMSKVGETTMARRGMSACAVALALLATIPLFMARGSLSTAIHCLQAAAVCMSFTSATVVNSLTAAASLQCDEPIDNHGKSKDVHPQLAKGTALGSFRSSGQLGRAIGPLIGAFTPVINNDMLADVPEQPADLTGLSGHRLPIRQGRSSCSC
jgi:hypothetical protein